MADERPPCPRCSFPYEPGVAERYWEARWRDEAAENDRLRASLRAVAPHETMTEQLAIKDLAGRLWRVHPREIQDMGITRQEFYEREIAKTFEALAVTNGVR